MVLHDLVEVLLGAVAVLEVVSEGGLLVVVAIHSWFRLNYRLGLIEFLIRF